MKRWLARAVLGWLTLSMATILVLGSLAGCQPVYLTQEAMQQAHEGLPKNLEVCQDKLLSPLSKLTAAPATVLDADRTPQYLDLQEAIAIALQSGTVTGRGISNLFGLVPAPGGSSPTTTDQGFQPASQNDSIRVLSLNPAAKFTGIESSIARFDPVFSTYSTWTNLSGIPGVFNNGTNFQDTSLFGNVPGQGGRVGASILKGLPSGGVAEIGMLVDYANRSNNAGTPLNPQYSARTNISFEQPLWRDFGVGINQLLPIFPGITGQGLPDNHEGIAFNQHQGRIGGDGILIARLKFDQSRAHLENNVNALVANVEIAYWNLYNKYGQLYSLDENLRIVHKLWQKSDGLFKGGGGPNFTIEGHHQIRGQYEEFRGERLRALNEVLEAERNLRSILGMPVEDGTRLVPITPPTMVGLKPDWESCIKEALNVRPDLEWLRQEYKRNEFNLRVQQNNLKPDLRLIARYEPYGEGSTLTGSGTFLDNSGTSRSTNALNSLTHNHLADWQLGLSLNMPLGFRAEYAAIRFARLELTKSYLLLKDAENQVVFQVAKEYQDLERWYNAIRVHRAERNGYGDSLATFDKKDRNQQRVETSQFLEAQRRYAAASVKEYQAIAEYNNSLARLEWAKGTIMRYDNVHIGEGALPEGVQLRAVDYQKERTKALMLRARPDSLHQPGLLVGSKGTEPTSLPLDPDEAKNAALPPIVPAKQEEDRFPLPQITPRPAQETRSPSKGEVMVIEFRPEGTPKAAPLRTPAPPAPMPMPMVIPANTGPLPAAPGPQASLPNQKQVGAAGFVTIDGPTAFAAIAPPRVAAQLPTLASPAVRASSGGPEIIDFAPPR